MNMVPKVGDRVVVKNGSQIYTVREIKDGLATLVTRSGRVCGIVENKSLTVKER